MTVSFLKHLPLVFLILCPLSFFSLPQALFAQDGGTVTVRLFETYQPKSIGIDPPFVLLSANSRSKINIPCTASAKNGRICLKFRQKRDYPGLGDNQSSVLAISSQLSLQEVDHKGINLLVDLANPSHRNRKYHGIITLNLLKDGTVNVINKVSRRDYVTGVVASESPKNAPYEMLRAQAVLVQTLLARQKDLALLGDSTQSQCYLGSGLQNPLIERAIESVWRQNIYYKDLPINVYYHSTCAGGTSNGAKFFHTKNKNLVYLAEVPCKNCSESLFWRPTITEISGSLFAKVFGSGLPQIIESDYTDRPLLIQLGKGKTITGYDFWISLGQHFGWDKAPGTRVKLKTAKNGNIIIESTGAGHGVGLCQWGAAGLAKQGKSYQEILRYYFPGCVVH